MARETKTILVTGDVVVDHNIYIGQRVGPDSREKLGTRTVKSLGGAGLLHRIVEAMVAAKGDDAEVAFGLKTVGYNTLPPHLHCYAVWAPDAGVWRLTQPLGYGAPADGPASCPVEPTLSVDDPAHIIVLDDGGLGFRSKVSEAAWPKYLRGGRVRKPDWVVLKMSSPVCLGDLWRKIQSKLDGKGQTKLVVVVSVDDLRREEVRVSSRISWERTVTDLINELSRNAALRELRKCAHLIVSFGVEGALHLDNSAPRRPAYRLVFDPENMEGEFGEGSGGLGYLSSLTAGIVGELAGGAKKPDIVRGIRVGLSAMRQALEHGHGEVDETSKDSGPEPGLPLEDMARQSVNPEGGYAVAEVSAPSRAGVLMDYQWSLLCTDPAGEPPMCGRAKRIALVGPKAVGNVPYARFGKLLAVDRNEIESLRILRRLIKDYDKERKTGRPLSIAVFGPPGAGKSFGVKQIAKAMYGDDASILEFNLSQFTKPQELIGLFHQIRDEVLKGVVPVVFWDEFDSKEYLWLQYFLAPMQDGAFQDGQITHPIGKCIFIFAGGTSPTMANFGPPKADTAKWNEFKLRKGPDFCSRLSGYMDVLGPNQRQVLKPKGRGSQWVDDPLDIYFPIRRALLLRAVLGCKENQRLEIDRGVLAAFIEVPKYYHGARSLEKIAVSFRQNNVQSLRRSGLPPAEVMSMHADPDEFMWIVNRSLPYKVDSEKLAPAVHEYYLEEGKKKGWKVKYDMPYDRLPPDVKGDNVAAAMRIPEVLELVGLYVASRGKGEVCPPSQVKAIVEKHIEMLAEAEHDGWMEHKKKNDWTLGPRDDDQRVHDALALYGKLSEENKEKDRGNVRDYGRILAKANYIIVKAPPKPEPKTRARPKPKARAKAKPKP